MRKIGIILSVLAFCASSCTPNKTDKQYLLYANYLSYVGLGNPVYLMNAVKHDKIKSIGFYYENENRVFNDLLLFNENGDLMSISPNRLSGTKFIYNDKGTLLSIENPTHNYYGIEADNIDIMYSKKGIPTGMIFTGHRGVDTVQVVFNEKDEEYLIRRNNETRLDGYLFDQHIFENNRIVAEYHKNRFYDADIDSTLYIYEENKLVRNIRSEDKRTITITEYDNLSRPTIGTRTHTYPDKIIVWKEKYYYEGDNMFPSKIETISPREEITIKHIMITKWEEDKNASR